MPRLSKRALRPLNILLAGRHDLHSFTGLCPPENAYPPNLLPLWLTPVKKIKLSLQPSEGVVLQVAGQIYSAYVSSGKVVEGKEQQYMDRSLQEAMQLALMTDKAVQSDAEFD